LKLKLSIDLKELKIVIFEIFSPSFNISSLLFIKFSELFSLALLLFDLFFSKQLLLLKLRKLFSII
jgi:hypothetical protein